MRAMFRLRNSSIWELSDFLFYVLFLNTFLNLALAKAGLFRSTTHRFCICFANKMLVEDQYLSSWFRQGGLRANGSDTTFSTQALYNRNPRDDYSRINTLLTL